MTILLSAPQSRPKVILWYRIYAGALTFLYFACAVGFALTYFLSHPEQAFREMPLWFFKIYWWGIIALCLVLGSACLTSFFLKPKPWVWVYGLVLIGLGLTSACCLPASIPLLIYWLKPETKAYFGRS